MSARAAWLRPLHRFVAACFTVVVLANFAVRPFGEPPAWLTYLPLLPLALLWLSGLVLWLQHRRAPRPGDQAAGAYLTEQP